MRLDVLELIAEESQYRSARALGTDCFAFAGLSMRQAPARQPYDPVVERIHHQRYWRKLKTEPWRHAAQVKRKREWRQRHYREHPEYYRARARKRRAWHREYLRTWRALRKSVSA